MKGDAIKHIAATVAAGIEPTGSETGAAIDDAADIILGFFADVTRIADAAVDLADCATGSGIFDVRKLD